MMYWYVLRWSYVLSDKRSLAHWSNDGTQQRRKQTTHCVLGAWSSNVLRSLQIPMRLP